jgi:DNA repair exonuclease SbcCD ATPase subunit
MEKFYITQLVIESIGIIRAMRLEVGKAGFVKITGDNAQGKSTVLKAILLALTNKGLAKPITSGEEKGKIQLTLSGDDESYYITRSYTEKGDYLKVEDAIGDKVPEAQTFLKKMFGSIAFDPVAFAGMDDKKQLESLKDVLGIDTDDLEEKYKEFFEDRAVTNREVASKKKQLEALPKPPVDTPEEEVNVSDLVKERDEIDAALTVLGDAITVEQEAESAIQCAKDEVSEAIERLAAAKKDLEDKEAAFKRFAKAKKRAQADCEGLSERRGVISDEIEGADEANAVFREAVKWRGLRDEYRDVKVKSEALTEALRDIVKEKEERIKAADLPVEGLGFGADCVTLNGLPFSQASHSEQIKVSTLIAMRQNPELRDIFIEDAAVINDETLKLISDIAKEKEYKVWFELFQPKAGKEGIHIFDGEVISVDGKEVENVEE